MPTEQTHDAGPAHRLAGAAGPFLRAHAGDPVPWWPWGNEAFEAARTSARPVLLWVGSWACPRCRAMGRESFADPALGAWLAEQVVCVIVDREERPEIAALYAGALSAMTGQTGWPVTMLLTPDRVPIHAATYLPPDDRDGTAGLPATVAHVLEAWRTQRDELQARGRAFLEHLGAGEGLDPWPTPPADEALGRAAGRLHVTYDEEHGGFGTGAKLPRPVAVDFLVRMGARGIAKAKPMADRTLSAMAQGAIWDHVGGGFHRCTADRAWLLPSFEKLLADQALLGRTYTHAWQAWRTPLTRRIAQETLEYVVRDLTLPSGAFAAGEAADRDFYTWRHDEVSAVAPGALGFFGVREHEEHNVLRAQGDEPPADAVGALRAARAQRTRPERDDRVLASWNGLAIAALAEAGAAFGRDDLLRAAGRAAEAVTTELADGAGGVHHTAGVDGALDDHAYLADGLLTLWEATFERRWLDVAEQLAARMQERFWDAGRGAFRTAPADRDDLVAPVVPVMDAATPSGNAVAALVLLRLAALTGDGGRLERAASVLRVAAPYIEADPLSTAGFLAAVEVHAHGPKTVAVVGDPADDAFRALAEQTWVRLLPTVVRSGGPPGSGAPLTDGLETDGSRPVARVTESSSAAHSPVRDPVELGRLLRPWRDPTAEQVDELVRRMEGAVQYRHLFDQLQNPRWMTPLAERGFFTTPPATVIDYTRGTIGSPPWPESGYLARAAQEDPGTAHAIGMAIPDTENAQVHEDLADLALALPAPLAADFVPRLAGWAGLPYHLLMADKLGKLLTHLATGGEIAAALELGRSMLGLAADPSAAAPGEDRFRPDPSPKAKFEEFEWTTIVSERVPELVEAAGLPALGLLCEALEEAIALSARPGEDAPPTDHSHIWRPAIEEEPASEQTVRDLLLTATRDAAVALARRSREDAVAVVGALRARSRHVFRRIVLHLLRELDEIPEELVHAALLDRATLDDPHFHHEYLLLAADRLPDLDAADRDRILGWIAEGPTDEQLLAVARTGEEHDLPGIRKRWTRDRLAMLLDVVPPELVRRYEEVVAEMGEPEHPEFAAAPGVGKRRNSPKSAEDLRRMGPDAVLDFLGAWRPPGGWARPSRDGLANEVMLTVGADPEPYAKRADRFRRLHPAYVEALLFGLREATKRELPFPWEPVVELCVRLLDEGAGRAATEGATGVDDPHAGIRREMAHLLSAGFAPGPGAIPIELRTSVWRALRRLTEDPDPTPEQEDRLMKAGVELATVSTNTTRGKALHATVRYALWVRRHIESGPRSVERLMRGFDEMPEVREVLDAHLDPKADPSPALRVVYGWWLPWLVMMDPEWTRRRLPEILPRERALEEYRHAAWGAYVTFNTPYENIWSLLKGEYRRMAERLRPKGDDELHLPGPDERLGEHLLSVYWRGKVRLEESDSALARFFARAPDALAAHVITFAGRSLPGWKGPVPGEVKLRLMKLWERRLAVARRDPAAHQRELAAYGWWYATGMFEERWALEQLDAATALTGGRIDSTHLAVAKLAEAAPRAPGKAVGILARIVAGDRGRTIVGWRDQGRAVLTAVLESDDEQARSAAVDLMDAFTVEQLPQDTTWEAPAGKPSSTRGASPDMRPVGAG